MAQYEKLSEHPLVKADYLSLEGGEKALSHQLRYLLNLDSSAVYVERDGSVIVYYVSKFAVPVGGCGRIVLDRSGQRLRGPETIGFDPRNGEAA